VTCSTPQSTSCAATCIECCCTTGAAVHRILVAAVLRALP
jgi:hypothetical protein